MKKITGKYIVVQPFKYDGKSYSRGEEWYPTGGKWDDRIIAQGRVRFVRDPIEPEVADEPEDDADEKLANTRSRSKK